MNERIKKFLDTIDVNPKIRELAEQSGCSIDRLGFGEGNLEKFAELIVQECAGVTEQYRGTEWGKASECIGDSILEHFGVD